MPRIQLVYPTVMVAVWFSKRSSMWIPPFLKAQKGMAKVNDEYTARHCLLSDSFAAYLAYLLQDLQACRSRSPGVDRKGSNAPESSGVSTPDAHTWRRSNRSLNGFPNQRVLSGHAPNMAASLDGTLALARSNQRVILQSWLHHMQWN